MNKKVLLGMSGGVDSSVAAILLKEQGYEVNKLWIDNGVNTEWTGWGPMESREEKPYCNGITIDVDKQVKEYRK